MLEGAEEHKQDLYALWRHIWSCYLSQDESWVIFVEMVYRLLVLDNVKWWHTLSFNGSCKLWKWLQVKSKLSLRLVKQTANIVAYGLLSKKTKYGLNMHINIVLAIAIEQSRK